MLSTATSPQLMCLAGLNEVSDGTVSSPEQKNPKKHSVEAAQSITMSGSAALGAQEPFCRWIAVVIGSLTLTTSGE